MDGDLEKGVRVPEDEVLEPLILRSKEKAGETRKEPISMALLSTAISVWGSFEFGTCIGYSSPTQPGIRAEIGLSLSEFSVFGSILTIGAMVGAVTSGKLADCIGRKGAMRLSSVFCLLGWLAIYFAKGTSSLYLGRLSTGYGIGILSYVVPIFIAEIAPNDLRGGLITISQLMNCFGGSAALIIGTMVNWRMLALIGIIPCILLLFGLFLIPESPRWLAKAGNQKEFENALQRLRGKGTDISEEAADIQENINILEGLPTARFLDLCQEKYIRSVIVGVGLMIFQQLGGFNGISFYASETFVSAGFSSGDLGTLLMGSIQVPITLLGAILMDKSGRKPLLLISATGSFFGTFLAGVAFYMKAQGLLLNWVPTLALVGILVYVGFYSIGMGAVPWVMMSEIFPLNIKAIGGSLVTLVNWFGSWVISYSFNYLMGWSSSGTLFTFAAASALTVLFVVKFVPETKGRSLEEIQCSLNS